MGMTGGVDVARAVEGFVFQYREKRWTAAPKCWRFMCGGTTQYPSLHETLTQRPFWKAKLDRFVDKTPQARYERLMRARSLITDRRRFGIYWAIHFAYQLRCPVNYRVVPPRPGESIPAVIGYRMRRKRQDAERLAA